MTPTTPDEHKPALDDGINRQTGYTCVIHDGNGTWFGAGSFWVSALTDEELEQLEGGKESVLVEVPAVRLLELVSEEFPGESYVV
jgi:hypothetical protein